MKLLVTGGAGFIGSHYIDYVLQKHSGIQVVCLDKMTYAANAKNLSQAAKNPSFSFVKGDICDGKLVESIVGSGVNIIVNFAAQTHVDRSIRDCKQFVRTNIDGTRVLLEAAKKHKIKRFHQISTDEVYGQLGFDDNSFTEKSVLNPSNPYSASKAAADLLVMAYYKTYGLDVTITRCGNNFGQRQHSEKFIPKCIINSLQGKNICIYGNGENIRDWIYVKDHCAAVDTVVFNGKPGQIYNVGACNEISNIKVATTILQLLNLPQERIKFVTDRAGHDLRYALNVDKIKQQLGFCAVSDTTQCIKDTINWYKDNIKKPKRYFYEAKRNSNGI